MCQCAKTCLNANNCCWVTVINRCRTVILGFVVISWNHTDFEACSWVFNFILLRKSVLENLKWENWEHAGPSFVALRDTGGTTTTWHYLTITLTVFCSNTSCNCFPGDLQEDPAALPTSFLLPQCGQPQHECIRSDGVQQLSTHGFLPCWRFPGDPCQPQWSSCCQCPLWAPLWHRRHVYTEILCLQLTGTVVLQVYGFIWLQCRNIQKLIMVLVSVPGWSVGFNLSSTRRCWF